MNINLTNDLLLIRRIVVEEPKTKWGFILPPGDDSAETPLQGIVLAAGPGRRPKASHAAKEVSEALAAMIEAEEMVDYNPEASHRGRAALANDSPDRTTMQVKPGDTVIFSRHGFQEFKIDGETLIVTQEASILGIIDGAD